jgi:ribosomal protein L37AE/L43A
MRGERVHTSCMRRSFGGWWCERPAYQARDGTYADVANMQDTITESEKQVREFGVVVSSTR